MALFGGGDEQLQVTIKAKDEASAELNKVQLSVGQLAKGFALGTIAVDAFRAGFRFLSGIVTASIQEFEQQNQAIAQTNAVLQSTQHAAGLTAKEVIGLSKSISDNTLYQDDMVLSAENLLLTFTNITKDIFPETTQAVLDMSTALGQDLSSSAIQLGKALNNPIEGVSALQRVGVSFNNAQQEVIATMVKSGRTMDAQRYILAELQKEFGGSAKSAYESASSITKLQKSVKDLEEDIGAGLTPALNNLFSAFEDTTKGTGEYNDKALIAFTVTSKLAEAAVAAAIGFAAIGTGIIDATSYIAQFILDGTKAGTVLKAFGYDSDKYLSGVRQSVNEGLASGVDFYDALKDRNDAVVNDWGQINTQAAILAKKGPAAYQATAVEAKNAADAIKKTQQAISDTHKELDDFRASLVGDTEDLGKAYVDQQEKIKGLEKEIQQQRGSASSAQDLASIAELQTQLDKEKAALEGASAIPTLLPTQVADATRRAGLTDFGRNVEDIQRRVLDQEKAFQQQVVNINFNGTTAGDEGIKQIIAQAMAVLNRESTLRSVAGR